MSCFLGIDTSNYTTSAAIFEDNKIIQSKMPLPVKSGSCGLRQSDAVFHHTAQLYGVIEKLPYKTLTAVGASAFPRRIEGSYMPCFTVGLNTAKILSHILQIPIYEFSHQEGHIAAALFSADRLDLFGKKFIAFHVSGGTTEAVLVEPTADNILNCKIIADSLDLKAGQAIDRVGVALGLSFPCGKELEKLSRNFTRDIKATAVMRGNCCSLSGIENKCKKLISENEAPENVARFCIKSVCCAVEKMTEAVLKEYGKLPLVYAGGVMSNSYIKKTISEKYNGYFAEPDFSSDNASGIAILASYKQKGAF